MSPRNGWFLAAVVLAAGALTGCSPAQPVIGKWQMDTSKVMSQISASMPAVDPGNPGAAMAVSMAQGMMKNVKVEIEFKQGGKAIFTANGFGKNKSETGTWRYKKTEGDTIVLLVTNDKKKQEEMRIKIIDKDNIEMMPPTTVSANPVKVLPFTRVKTT